MAKYNKRTAVASPKPKRFSKKATRKPAKKRTARKPTVRKTVLKNTVVARKTVKKKPLPARKPIKKPLPARKPAKKPVTVRKPTKKPLLARKPTKKPAPARKPTKKPLPARKPTKKRRTREEAERRIVELERQIEEVKKQEEESRKREGEAKASSQLLREQQKKMRVQLHSVYQERFGSILEVARLSGQIPEPKDGFGAKPVETRDRIGDRMTIQVDMQLRSDTLDAIGDLIENESHWMAALPHPIWLAEFNLVGLGEKLFGYGATTLRIDDPIASQFQVQGTETTGLQTSYRSMLLSLMKELRRLSGDDSTIVYVTHVSLSGFGRR